MKPVLRQNGQKLSVRQGGFTGTSGYGSEWRGILSTDRNLHEKHIGDSGDSGAYRKISGKERTCQPGRRRGSRAEETRSLDHYDAEMNTATHRTAKPPRRTGN